MISVKNVFSGARSVDYTETQGQDYYPAVNLNSADICEWETEYQVNVGGSGEAVGPC